MDLMGDFASVAATIGRTTGAIVNGAGEFLQRNTWFSGWAQALIAAATIPATFFVAAWSSRKAATDALRREWLTRAQTYTAERERLEEQARHELFERHCNLATQILYCDLRIRWSGQHLKGLTGEDQIGDGLESVHHLVDIIDYYAASIREIGLRNTRVHHELQPITAPIDEVLILLMVFRRGLSIVIQESLGADVEAARRMEFVQAIGAWAIDVAGDINTILLRLVDLMGPDVAVWVKRKRPDLEKAFGKEEMQNIPQLLLTMLAHRRATPPAPRPI